MKKFLNKLPFGKKKPEKADDEITEAEKEAPKGRKKKSFVAKEKIEVKSDDKTTFQPLQSKSLLSEEDIRSKSHHPEEGKPHPKKNIEKETFFASITSLFNKNKVKKIPEIKSDESDVEFFPDVDNNSKKDKVRIQISPVRALILIIIIGGAGYVGYDFFIGGDSKSTPLAANNKSGRVRKRKAKPKKPVAKKKTDRNNSNSEKVAKKVTLNESDKKNLNNSIKNRIKKQMEDVGAANKKDFADKDLLAKNSNFKDRLEKLNSSSNSDRVQKKEDNTDQGANVKSGK
ncbi:hypothetical protein N9N67_11825, partial [Bacteriovoracaceae bacterium]|nr:hypothetical protein [Bacteriovoracaceae bacterium]